LKEIVKIAISSSNEDEMKKIDKDRIFGPRNAILNSECILGIKGGCRMLSCTCKEEDDIWFTNSCDCCFKKIRNISHCIRFPLEDGGWLGCYCSLDCMTQQPPLNVN